MNRFARLTNRALTGWLLLGVSANLPLLAQPVAPQSADASATVPGVRVVSVNVRYGTADDGENHWDLRKDLLAEVLQQARPDLIGTQEIMPFQAEFLREQLGDFQYVGRSRDLDNPDGEQSGVFFRASRFVELERGHFWLSETPERPGSQSWDAALPRMATWLKLFDRQSDRPLVMINTHFDHRGQEARQQSAAVLRDHARPFAASYPLIVTGDFNCPEGSGPYTQLTAAGDMPSVTLIDVYRAVHPQRVPDEGTFNGFQRNRDGRRIDWILANSAWQPVAAQIITTERDGRFPSDHFPVLAELKLP